MPGEESKTGSDDLKALQESIKGLTDSVTAISQMVGQQAQAHAQLTGNVNGLVESLNKVQTSRNNPPKQLPDFDKMENPGDVAKALLGVVREEMKSITDTHKQEVDSLRSELMKGERRKELTGFASSKKDFDEWVDEMSALAKDHPNMSVERLYKLARVENPEKAAELDAKHNPPEKKEEAEPFFGLTPTSDISTRGGEESKGKEGKMSLEDAVEAAWKEVGPAFDKAARAEDPLI